MSSITDTKNTDPVKKLGAEEDLLHNERPDVVPEYRERKAVIEALIVQRYQERLERRKQDYNNFSYAYKPFVEIVGEYTRADNTFCGINGCADHEFLSEKLREISEKNTNTNDQAALRWLASIGNGIRATREQILTLLSIDQAANKANIRRFQEQELSDAILSDSSLGDIPDKEWDEVLKSDIRQHIGIIGKAVDQWQRIRTDLSEVGQQCKTSLRSSYDESQIATLIHDGNLNEGAARSKAFEELSSVLTKYLEVIGNDQLDDQQQSKAFEALMDNLTNAQAVLEGQYYFVGVALIRATQNNTQVELPKEVEYASEASFSMGLDEKTKSQMSKV